MASEPSGLAQCARGPLGRWCRGSLAAEGGADGPLPLRLFGMFERPSELTLTAGCRQTGGTWEQGWVGAGRGPGYRGLAVVEGVLGSRSAVWPSVHSGV